MDVLVRVGPTMHDDKIFIVEDKMTLLWGKFWLVHTHTVDVVVLKAAME